MFVGKEVGRGVMRGVVRGGDGRGGKGMGAYRGAEGLCLGNGYKGFTKAREEDRDRGSNGFGDTRLYIVFEERIMNTCSRTQILQPLNSKPSTAETKWPISGAQMPSLAV